MPYKEPAVQRSIGVQVSATLTGRFLKINL